jgi:hypothetical protein
VFFFAVFLGVFVRKARRNLCILVCFYVKTRWFGALFMVQKWSKIVANLSIIGAYSCALRCAFNASSGEEKAFLAQLLQALRRARQSLFCGKKADSEIASLRS